jgi:hypothetical protein
MWADPAVASVFSMQTLGVLWIGAFVGGFAAGAAGFTFGIVASAVWLHALDRCTPRACGVRRHRHSSWNHLADAPRNQHPPSRAVCAAAWWNPHRRVVARAHRRPGAEIRAWHFSGGLRRLRRHPAVAAYQRRRTNRDGAIGFFGGILGGIGGYSGVLPAIWCQLRGWSKKSRGVYQPFIIMAHITTLSLIGVVALDRAVLYCSCSLCRP